MELEAQNQDLRRAAHGVEPIERWVRGLNRLADNRQLGRVCRRGETRSQTVYACETHPDPCKLQAVPANYSEKVGERAEKVGRHPKTRKGKGRHEDDLGTHLKRIHIHQSVMLSQTKV